MKTYYIQLINGTPFTVCGVEEIYHDDNGVWFNGEQEGNAFVPFHNLASFEINVEEENIKDSEC